MKKRKTGEPRRETENRNGEKKRRNERKMWRRKIRKEGEEERGLIDLRGGEASSPCSSSSSVTPLTALRSTYVTSSHFLLPCPSSLFLLPSARKRNCLPFLFSSSSFHISRNGERGRKGGPFSPAGHPPPSLSRQNIGTVNRRRITGQQERKKSRIKEFLSLPFSFLSRALASASASSLLIFIPPSSFRHMASLSLSPSPLFCFSLSPRSEESLMIKTTSQTQGCQRVYQFSQTKYLGTVRHEGIL